MRIPCPAVVLLLAAGVAGCSLPPSAATLARPDAPGAPLGAAAVAALYAAPHREDGVVVAGAHVGAHWTKWTKPDGSMELSAAHGLFADSGRFVLRGNAVCARWEQIDHGRENCMHLVRSGPDEYTSIDADGQPGSRFTVKPP